MFFFCLKYEFFLKNYLLFWLILQSIKIAIKLIVYRFIWCKNTKIQKKKNASFIKIRQIYYPALYLKILRGPVLYTPALKSRVTCYTLKKKHLFWKPGAFVELFPNCRLQINVNKNHQKCLQCFIPWLVNSSLYSWQYFRLTTLPQKYSTSAFIST